MKHTVTKTSLTALLLAVSGMLLMPATSSSQEDYDDYDYVARIDRYLNAEVWTDHADGDYFEGDNIMVHFRVNGDAFVVIYSIDSRGMVNLLFPTDPTEDNFVYGGVTYNLPDADDDYDLVVAGPEGMEHIQMIAATERFPIPNWYHNSGLAFDGEDRYDYMDYLNNRYFVRYSGQRFAYDRAVIYVNEWEDYYYQPVYYPHYPAWSVCGNLYIDYPWGSTIYINGYYWGCAPLYVPRLLVGWHTITVYDHYGYCWESDFHCSRYNTVVFDRAVIKTSATVTSKYASVQKVGYRDPVKHGYPNYKTKSVRMDVAGNTGATGPGVTKTTSGKTGASTVTTGGDITRKYVRGSSRLVKTARGYEIDGASANYSGKTKRNSSLRSGSSYKASDASGKSSQSSSGSTSKSGSSGFYEKKSGGSGKSWTGSSKSSSTSKGKTSSGSGKYKPSKSSVKSTPATVKPTKKSNTKKAEPAKKSSSTVKPKSSSQSSSGKSKSAGSSTSSKSGGKSSSKSSGGGKKHP